ncbi:MAG: hypothetical protein V9F04_12645 [Dermatophilaceae bacterium]
MAISARRGVGGPAAAAAVLAATLGLSGCTGDADAPVPSVPFSTKQSISKGEIGLLRTEVEPLAKRYPGLGKIVSAQWFGGTLGDARAPGPSTVWIDAVIELEPATMARLRAAAGTTRTETPDVVPELLPLLPLGPYGRSGTLDTAIKGTLLTRAWLPPTGNQLVIAAMGQ